MSVVFVEYDTGDPNLPNPSGHIEDLYEDASDSTDEQSDDENSESESRNRGSVWGLGGTEYPSAFSNVISSFENRKKNALRLVTVPKTTEDAEEPKSPLSPLSRTRPKSGIMLKSLQTQERKSVLLSSIAPSPQDKEDGSTTTRRQPFQDTSGTQTYHANFIDSARVSRRYSTIGGGNNAARRKPGWEPGVDLDTTDVIIESFGSVVTIVDYSSDRCRLARTEFYSGDDDANSSSVDLNYQDKNSAVDANLTQYLESRPAWSRVRWINVNGLTKEAIYTIGQFYKLHKLAIEDMIDIPQRTKVDEYPLHTFCCLPLHRLVPYNPTTGSRARYQQFWDIFTKCFRANDHESSPHSRRSFTSRHSSGGTMDTSKFTGANFTGKMNSRSQILRNKLKPTSNMKSMYQWNNPTQKNRSDYLESRRPLAHRHKMVGVEQVSLFLTHERTVISFFEGSGEEIEKPILERLEIDSTILRVSCDPSILLQAIIDAIVDLVHPIIAAYRTRLSELELAAILNPSMAHTRDLHLINGDLTVLRNSITPLTLLINSLRDHATHKRKEFIEGSSVKAGSNLGSSTSSAKSSQTSARSDYSKISEYASVYLADVADHTLSYTQDLDIMRNNTKSMIDLIFNTISIQSSVAVKLLSLVTIIFLPLSFLTGYFGMNFTEFDALANGISYYWGIAVPCTAIMTILLMYPWVRDTFRKINQLIKRSRDHSRRKRRHKSKKRARHASQTV